MATILTLAELSSAVYGDTPVPAGWTIVPGTSGTSKPNSDGYFGVAYVNTTTHEIVIANRGTVVPSSLSAAMNLQTDEASFANLLNDAELAAHMVTPDELDAISFAKTIAGLVAPGQPYAGYSLIETGHSLSLLPPGRSSP